MTDKEKAAADREKLMKSLAAETKAEKTRIANMSRTDRKEAMRRAMRGESLEEAGRFAQYLNTVAMAGRKYEPGQKVFVKGRKGVEFQFHRYDDDGSAIVVSGGRKYRFHPLNVTHFAEAVEKPTKGKTLISNAPVEKIEPGVEGVKGGSAKTATVTMKIKEGRALTVAQRLQRGRQIRRIKPKLQRAAKRSYIQSPSASRIWKRSERAARTILKKRFSPVKGVAYANLSTTQKIFVDRALEKRQKLIRKVAKRLLPKVRAASFKRLQSYRMGSGRSRLKENFAFEERFNQRPLPKIIESMIVDMGDHPMADSLQTLLDLSAEKESPAVKSLKEKASSISVPFAEILQVYADALLEYKRTGSKLSGEQYAFNAVNVYVADRKAPTINEDFTNAFLSAVDNDLYEKFTSEPHGEDNKVTKGGHHLFRDGKHRADLELDAESPAGIAGHLYTCFARGADKPLLNSKGKPVRKTLEAWKADENGNLESHFKRHDDLVAMRTKTEMTTPDESMFLQLGTGLNMMRDPKKPLKAQAADVAGTAAKYIKGSAAEKLEKIRNAAKSVKQELKTRRALNKEPD